ncbi:MAG: site-specific DNA-methyltransferase [Hallerella succinigenes]|uniref:site-specific DNA-methyltransferase n=1 Tax=Hallerella succinigenes TaxID=1896222 RepID=UPI0023F3B67A|nr:site-specific DNA-methyltransferase [Hallerella succinigenes]MDD6092760.1 site-specific DNA-methyltransferase [Hallerella succinigenes]
MEKANMHSLDMVNENIKKIGNLFPECVTETVDENGNVKAAIDFEKLQENLSHATIGEGEERYQFTWPGKREAIHNANASTSMTLRPCKEESVDFDNTENLYIEGDNLEVLKLLQENYLGKVKMIYIDPPYNTGNDFVYNDDFKEDTESFQSKSGMYDEDGNMLLQNFEKNTESNGRFHTDWLNMMYPRLKIARNLLSDGGVIFISIDDNEQENLKKICDEVLGGGNHVVSFCWRRRKTQANLSKFVSQVHEYILAYAKNISTLSFNRIPYSKEYISKTFGNKDNDPKGLYQTGPLARPANSSNKEYTLTMPNGRKITAKWSCNQDTFNQYVKEGRLFIPKDGEGMPRIKIYLSELPGMIPNTWLDDVASNDDAARMIASIFGSMAYFDYSKPIELINFILNLGSDKNSIILDFFSGSATTAHAVMQLNAEDGGKRKFICVQLPEATAEDSEAYKAGYKNICEIGKERIRRAGKKIKEEFGEKAKDLDIGFRVLKLAESNMKDVYYSPAETDSADIFDANNVKEDRTPLDLLFQVMPECNLPLSSKIEERTIEGKTVYFVNGNYLVACFDEGITEKLIKAVIDVPDSDKPYYFYMRGLGLESDKVLDNFEQLFVHYSPTTKRKVI